MTGVPVVALLIGLLVQTLVTMAAYSIPAAAPAIAADLGVAGERVGVFIAIVYGVGMLSAVLSPGFIHRYGAVRVSQFIVLAGLCMLCVTAAGGTVVTLGIGAVLLGLGYGATAPSSSHLLVQRTPAAIHNLVFSVRQIGVPLGGVLGGLLVPPLVLHFSWQTAIGIQIIPTLLLLILLQFVRARYDADRDPAFSLRVGGLIGPLRLFRSLNQIRPLVLAVFFFAGTQLCFVSYISVHLTGRAGFDLVAAGQMLAAYQIAGVVSRPIWGTIADRWIPARILLGLFGFVMAAMALLAGSFSAEWSRVSILVVALIAGASASGYTGIAFAEFARIGGKGSVAEATGLGAFSQFFGVMVLPPVFGLLVSVTDYAVAYRFIAALALISGAGLLIKSRSADEP